METPQPPQVSVSGSIVIQGQLTPPSSPIAESEPPVLPPAPWWQFWRWRAERVLVGATIVLAIATVALVGTAIIPHGDALDAIKATNRFAKAAEDYTNYTKSLALSSTQLIEANIASERATFQISKFELVEKQPNDPTTTVNFSFINLGRTARCKGNYGVPPGTFCPIFTTSLSHNLRKNFFLSVNYLTLPTDFLNDTP